MPDIRPTPRPTQLQGITDLTLFADIKPGLIEGIFDSRSYTWRLQRVLELLDAARRARREADVMPNPFIDGIARFRGIQFFRFAILPPGNKLFLNVTFDGGWEPYIRLIWDPLGTMLDLIFCHCEGYPLAAASSFEDYVRWIRKHEVPSQFFYADSGGTAADRTYLNRLETQQRAGGDRPGADLRAAQLALDNPLPPQPTLAAVIAALRTLKGLFGLTQFFGMTQPDLAASVPMHDGSVLLRFAQDFLPDLRAWYAQGLFDPGQQFGTLRQPFERERMWLMSKKWTRPKKLDRPAPTKSSLQAGILNSPKAPDGRFARGALVLARVIKPDAARQWLKSSSSNGLISDGSTTKLEEDRVVCAVAITYPGLQELGVHESHLESLPAEFAQGMEARAGILGDLRINHPQQWSRPRAWKQSLGSPPVPVDLPLVHLVIQLRTCESADEQGGPSPRVDLDRSTLLPRLKLWIDTKLPSGAIEVLAVEPAWSRPSAEGEPASRDHFGYVDGVSQPLLTPSAGSVYWDDAVKTGELLLGWVNDRGDGPLETPDRATTPTPAWLDLGTFLVVRKIRQYVDRFDRIVGKTSDVLLATGRPLSIDYTRELVSAKLMGRGTDGTPLTAQRGPGANDFDFRFDADGAQCPFASHVRRANPRAAVAGVRPPRIMRRGMSYGRQGRDQNERGVLFMAYNASIAEQFEVIQRWLTGGNSSGVSSSQPDPLLGVPRVGEPAVFLFTDKDKVVRVDLGDQPLCKLEWGLYAFVPSMALLQDLELLVADPEPANPARPEEPPAVETPEEIRMRVKAEFEDDIGRRARWKKVHGTASHVEKIGNSVMVGGFNPVMQVLKDPGSTFSAAGYGERMKDTLGQSPFGQDDGDPKIGHERAFVRDVKKAIGNAVSEEKAYDTAYRFTSADLAKQLAVAQAMGLPGASVDFVELGSNLIADLCKQWFGVVYGDGIAEAGGMVDKDEPVRCPGHFLSVARNVFSAYPNETVEKRAKSQGVALKAAVERWVADAAKAPSAPVLNAVLNAIAKDTSDEERNGIVANVMLGLPATLLGSWGKLLRAWTTDRRLWRFQYELSLLDQRPVPNPAHANDVRMDYAVARGALRNALILTMAADPVADGIWRTAVQAHTIGSIQVDKGDIVWLGLGAALSDKAGDVQTAEDLLFGGVDSSAPHACPGRELAIGALLGALAALLLAGQWAPTASPTTLSLRPPLP